MIFGAGKYSKGKYRAKIYGKMTKEYMLWYNMLARCYSEKYKKDKPTYMGCYCSELFKTFNYLCLGARVNVGSAQVLS